MLTFSLKNFGLKTEGSTQNCANHGTYPADRDRVALFVEHPWIINKLHPNICIIPYVSDFSLEPLSFSQSCTWVLDVFRTECR